MKNLYRTKTHNHGNFYCDQDNYIAFIRISKSGSTSLHKVLKLTHWVPFTNKPNLLIPPICFIRNPYERFLSSIFETLRRASATEESYPGKVTVSSRIYNNILSCNITSPEIFLTDFMNIIDNYGYFDAHHEPQTNFFLSKDGKPECNPILIGLHQMSGSLQLILEDERFAHLKIGVSSRKYNNRSAVHLSIDTNNSSKYDINAATGKLDSLQEVHDQGLIKLPAEHPLARLFNLPMYGECAITKTRLLMDDISIYYQKYFKHQIAFNSTFKKVYKEFILRNYEKDLDIYRKLMSNKLNPKTLDEMIKAPMLSEYM